MLNPASGLCNMRCKYCFYMDEMQKRATENFGFMSVQVLQNTLRTALAACTRHCSIVFQGGEPTLAGLDFFRTAVQLAEELNVNRCSISYSLQTNGLLIDEDWCRFLAEHHFLVGVSLDGPRDLHDANRVDLQGKGTFQRVMNALQLLKKFHVDTNILAVLTRAGCRNYRKIHTFFLRNAFAYQQFIPCLDPLDEPRGLHPWSLTSERYAQYLKDAFDLWYQQIKKGARQFHQYFDNLLLILDGQPPQVCAMGGLCSLQYVGEADGSVYPCDFYMLDHYKLGNFLTDTLEQIDRQREQLRFVEQSQYQPEECRQCRWFSLCRGGCRRDRDFFSDGLGKNYLCDAYKSFFEYAYPRLLEVYSRLLYFSR